MSTETPQLEGLTLRSIEWAAAKLDVSMKQVHRFITAGQLRGFDMGLGAKSYMKVAEQDVLNLLAGRVVQRVQETKTIRLAEYSDQYLQQRRNRG